MTHWILQLPNKNYLFESSDFNDCYDQLANMFTAEDAENFRLEHDETLWITLESMITCVNKLEGFELAGYFKPSETMIKKILSEK